MCATFVADVGPSVAPPKIVALVGCPVQKELVFSLLFGQFTVGGTSSPAPVLPGGPLEFRRSSFVVRQARTAKQFFQRDFFSIAALYCGHPTHSSQRPVCHQRSSPSQTPQSTPRHHDRVLMIESSRSRFDRQHAIVRECVRLSSKFFLAPHFVASHLESGARFCSAQRLQCATPARKNQGAGAVRATILCCKLRVA